MKRHLGVTAIALSLLGCSAQANMQASAGSKVAQAESASGAEALQPRESTFDREAREEAETAARYGSPVPNTTVPEADAPQEQTAEQAKSAAPADKGARHAKKSQRGRGKAKKHGKNAEGAEIAAVSADEDHDRGHGNDLDGVDQDNPGKRKKK